jgi:hypothetical protein
VISAFYKCNILNNFEIGTVTWKLMYFKILTYSLHTSYLLPKESVYFFFCYMWLHVIIQKTFIIQTQTHLTLWPFTLTVPSIPCIEHTQQCNWFDGTRQWLLSLVSSVPTRVATFAGLPGVFHGHDSLLKCVNMSLTNHRQNSCGRSFYHRRRKECSCSNLLGPAGEKIVFLSTSICG